jgi:hypothetical protein
MVSDPDWRGQREAKLAALHERLAVPVEGLAPGEDRGRAVVFAARPRSRRSGGRPGEGGPPGLGRAALARTDRGLTAWAGPARARNRAPAAGSRA